MTNAIFKKSLVDPADIITGARTIPARNAMLCHWLENEWLPSEVYLDWAKRGFNESDEYGFEVAINYSKKSVCRRIDTLILYNHLNSIFSKKKPYPVKLNALKLIGVKSFEIIYKFVIDPRNEIEHLYQKPTKEVAENAIQLAEMYLSATQPELELDSLICLNPSFQYREISSAKGYSAVFHGFSDNPMLIVNFYKKEILIVYPEEQEIIYADHNSFTFEQEVELSSILRKHFNQGTRSTTDVSEKTFKFLLSKL